MDQIREVIQWITEGKQAALATVIWKQGSALRGVGSKLAINSELEITGSVSGGCVEAAVSEEALRTMRTGEISIVEYGIPDEDAWSVGLTCGGKVKILIQPVNSDDSQYLNKELLMKMSVLELMGETFCVISVISGEYSGETGILKNGNVIFPQKKLKWVNKDLLQELNALEKKGTSGVIKLKGFDVFADYYFPKPRIVIIGAVHIAIPLVEISKICGFTMIVIDPRKTFANWKRFPMANDLIIQWPKEGLEEINLTKRDYLLILSHDDKLDLPALQIALDPKVGYIGMLSSPKTREARFTQLAGRGYSPEELKRIHAPVGLDIGSQSPEEIALSILAEIIAFRHKK